ncbi:translation elongation factor Ts [Candidatus Profftia sp. (ex Adelges kitamiensis)]|uniref:translation elongation factor Ts n=1 Tax=Candidatus Profftia sp. (ex Adelges kitamiensis) TaxID=2864218 RepID=UPI001CE255A8|nr:translation elongation factor Ts [Candidatus Profftia sp. (ex Adelges kitamiensis)]
MTDITTNILKELRKRTSVGVMDCKKALINSQGNIELAIENMRKSGAIKAAKKAINSATDGVIKMSITENYGVILEVNCQTDFVAKGDYFQKFAEKVLNTVIVDKITNIDILKSYFEKERIDLVMKIGEHINIRRVAALKGEVLAGYLHGTRIGVMVVAKNANQELAKQLAMHIAASKPEFINPENVSAKVVEKEYQIQLDIVMRSGKSQEIAEKIVKGRMKKFIDSVSLTGQNFIMDLNKTIGQLLTEYNAEVTNFIRFELGQEL